jgi:hypothetical protein
MGENSIYITLPSNTTNEMFPNNTISHYTVRLPKRIDFGDYEAALVEIQYPKSWTTIGGWIFSVMTYNTVRHVTSLAKVEIPTTKLNSVQSLLEVIRKRLDEINGIGHKYVFDYNEATGRTGFRLEDSDSMLLFQDNLREMLGFKQKHFRGDTDWHWSDYPTDISNGMTSLYVYSNIVQNQFVGDVMVPLLRTVPIRGSVWDAYRSEEFRHHHYLPLKNETTDLVEIKIVRDNGDSIDFQTGKVIVVLHLRRVSK